MAEATETKSKFVWPVELDVPLVECLLQLIETNQVPGGVFNKHSWKKAQVSMNEKLTAYGITDGNIKSRYQTLKGKHTLIAKIRAGGVGSGFSWDDDKKMVTGEEDSYALWVKANPGAGGLNKYPYPLFDSLDKLFGKDKALGTEAHAPGDVEIESGAKTTSTGAGKSFSYTAAMLDDETSQRVLEDLIRDGVDGRSMADIAPECTDTNVTSSFKRPKTTKKAGKGGEKSKLVPILEKTSVNIERITNTLCADDDVVKRRDNIYSEVSSTVGLNQNQILAASFKLMSDDRAAQLYYHIPTAEEKVQFLLALIN